MIETKRLILKPLSGSELMKLTKFPNKLAEDLGLTPSASFVEEEVQEAILNDLLPNLSDLNKDYLFYTMWIVVEKSKKAIIGGICFHGEPDEKGEVEIGYGTDDGYRNDGYMTETISGLVQWATANKKIQIIKAETYKTNTPSIRVLEKNNFEIARQNDTSVIMKLKIKH
ncbi:MAG: GNAT family N-acetyltransferase [Mangrovibacterium sp.]